jgi:hypothetical protein
LSVTGRLVVWSAAVSLILTIASLISFAIAEDPIAQHQLLQQQPTLGTIRNTGPAR